MGFIQSAEEKIFEVLDVPLIANQVNLLLWPDNPAADYSRVVGSGNLLIRFISESFDQPKLGNRTQVIQPGTLTFELRYLFKGLRTHSGAYEIMGTVRDLLTGVSPDKEGNYSPNEPGFYLVDSQFNGSTESIWDFGQRYELPVFYILKRSN